MSKLIAIDNGHGLNTPGKRTPVMPDGRVIHEWEFNHPTAKKLEQELQRCGLRTIMVSDTEADTPLETRTARANIAKADIFVSIHFNAYQGVWGTHGGVDTFYWETSLNGKRLASLVHKELVQATGLRDRGIKTKNFHVLRKTAMPAILCECGFMDNLEEAKLMLDETYQQKVAEAIGRGICEYSGTVYIQQPAQTSGNPIMGKAQATAEQMVAFLLQNNPNPKINCTPEELARYFIYEGEIEGIRGDVAFAQSLKETGYFRYGGQVLPEQNNYAGIGATNNSPVGKGAWFDSPQIGVRAQTQHLKAYANTDPLNNPCVDPRFNLVTRGIAPNWEDLNGRWAVPGPNYGQDIVAIWKKILDMSVSIYYKRLYEEKTKETQQLHQQNSELKNKLLQIRELTE